MTIRVPVTSILRDSRFEGMVLETQLHLGTQVMFEKNSTCSDWLDIVELARAQDVEVINQDEQPITEDFLKIMDDYRSKNPEKNIGISWRWVLAVQRGKVCLLVIGLPSSKKAIDSNDTLKHETTPGITLGVYNLGYER